MNENLEIWFSSFLENIKLTEIAFFFKSKIRDPKSKIVPERGFRSGTKYKDRFIASLTAGCPVYQSSLLFYLHLT